MEVAVAIGKALSQELLGLRRCFLQAENVRVCRFDGVDDLVALTVAPVQVVRGIAD
jgi:hypothetical protein